MDTRGLGKSPPLKLFGKRTENAIVSVHLGARDVLDVGRGKRVSNGDGSTRSD